MKNFITKQVSDIAEKYECKHLTSLVKNPTEQDSIFKFVNEQSK